MEADSTTGGNHVAGVSFEDFYRITRIKSAIARLGRSPSSNPYRPMQIKRIGFGYTKNLGNYENCKLWLEADLEDWEDPSESLNHLRNQVAQELNLPDKWHDLKGKFTRQSQALEATNAALQKAEKRWERYKNFLVAHGVNPDSLLINGYPFTSAEEVTKDLLPPLNEVETHWMQPGSGADDSTELGFAQDETISDYEKECYANWGDDDDDDY